jgi:hypothetical protein
MAVQSVVLLSHFGGALRRQWVLRGGVSEHSLAFLASKVSVHTFSKYERYSITASVVYINSGTCITDGLRLDRSNATSTTNTNTTPIDIDINASSNRTANATGRRGGGGGNRAGRRRRQVASEGSLLGEACVIEAGRSLAVTGRAASFVEFFVLARSDLYEASNNDTVLQERLRRARGQVNLLRWARGVLRR